jgi:polyhydroxybutyrate depolymerase
MRDDGRIPVGETLNLAEGARMTTSGGLVTGTLRVGDHERSLTMLKPRRTEAGGLPLVIALHGNSPDASGAMMRAWTSFEAHAEEWGIAVAWPDGYRGGWADGRGVTAADADGVDDVAFLSALIDWSAEHHGTRADHTIVAGISNGAFMAHRLALQASERVAAFGAVAGALPAALGEIQPTHAVSALLINGTADPLVSLGGGYSRHRGPGGELRGRILSQDETTEHWRLVNRCGSGPDFETVEQTPPSPDRPGWLGLTRRVITGGVGGTRVATVTVHGGGHTWPGSAPFTDPGAIAAIGLVAQNLDAAAELIRFARPALDAPARRRGRPEDGCRAGAAAGAAEDHDGGRGSARSQGG